MRLVAFTIAGLLGLFMITKPHIVWKLQNIFVTTKAEPKKDIIKFIKIQGYIIVAISVFGIIFLS